MMVTSTAFSLLWRDIFEVYLLNKLIDVCMIHLNPEGKPLNYLRPNYLINL